jgi:hypothetical protein
MSEIQAPAKKPTPWLIGGIAAAIVVAVLAWVFWPQPKSPEPQARVAVEKPARERRHPKRNRQAKPTERAKPEAGEPAAKTPELDMPAAALNQSAEMVMEMCQETYHKCFKKDEDEAANYCNLVFPGRARLEDPCEMFGFMMFFHCVRETINCDTYEFGKNKGPEDPYNVCKDQVLGTFSEQCRLARDGGGEAGMMPFGLPFMGGGKK